MDGPAPAILNAIEHATGIAFTEIPLLPEDIFERMTRTTDSGTEDLNPTIDRDTRVEARMITRPQPPRLCTSRPAKDVSS